MRRPRSRLQVSTFPFLAVLLCAMGSLLLLLFIMDRRAKIAAQNQVSEEVEARKARSKTEEDERQAEWAKAKAKLHQALVEQSDDVSNESHKLQRKLSDADKKLTFVQATNADLQARVKNEAAKIGSLQSIIADEAIKARDVAKKETASKAELRAATKELAELEYAFRQLRALKGSEAQTYSVVPYRGKRGDSRTPVYVECVRDGIVFHPDAKQLAGWAFSSQSIREEVESRHGPLAVQKAALGKNKPNAEEAKGPYVLFLIRPDGIETYYKAQAALRGYQLDFGYELVDQHWVLDFTSDGKAKQVASSKSAAIPANTLASTLPPPSPGALAAKGGGTIAPPGDGAFPGRIGSGPSVIPRPGSPGIPANTLENSRPPLIPGNALAKDGGMIAPPGGGSFPGGFGVGSAAIPRPGGNGGSVNPRIAPPLVEARPVTGVVNPGPSRGPSFVPIQSAAPPVPIASSGELQRPIASSGELQKPIAISGAPNPAGVSTSLMPRTDAVGTSPNGNGSQRPPNDQDGTTGAGGEVNPFAKPLPPIAVGASKKPTAAPTVTRLRPSKDFVITIDCQSDAATVLPGGMTYRWTAANLETTNRAVAETVANLIARRQASVRPGDSPYRPVIRFQVQPEGLRTYYHVYPLLEPLRVPMTRENVQE